MPDTLRIEEKRLKTKEWKEKNSQRVKELRREYYEKEKALAREGEVNKAVLRECSCGVRATTEAELELFTKDKDSKFGRKNKCKACTAKVTPKVPLKMQKTCTKCNKKVYGELQITKEFRIAKVTGDKVVGEFVHICKECEFPEDEYYEIDGKYILIADLHKPRGLRRIPIEAL